MLYDILLLRYIQRSVYVPRHRPQPWCAVYVPELYLVDYTLHSWLSGLLNIGSEEGDIVRTLLTQSCDVLFWYATRLYTAQS